MRRRSRAVIALLLAALVVAGGVAWFAWALAPVSGSRASRRFEVRSGEPPARIARALQAAGLIRSDRAFLLHLRLRGGPALLRSGAYRLSPALGARAIADRLERGPLASDRAWVMIPEGFTARQIAARLADLGSIRSAQAFMEVVRTDWRVLKSPFRLSAAGLEGYLFPETYEFPQNTSPRQAAQAMVDMFARRFYVPNEARIATRGRSVHEIVTIASLVEREAEAPQDRARIAGVIENRLRKRMPLQIDATVLYALGRHKDRVLYSDLRNPSPYNTYRHRGLPPGPIANPGLASLQAALFPEQHDYLFYVAKPDGSHLFTRTVQEHYRAVREMRALQAAGKGGAHAR